MKRPTFFEGVAVALAASLFGSIAQSLVTGSFGTEQGLRLVIALLGLGYLLYLLQRGSARVGRLSALAAWLVVAAALWLLEPGLPAYLLTHAGLIWLLRSFCFYASVLASLMDLGLGLLALLAGVWAAAQTASLFVSIWCFFLVQALFSAIPAQLRPKRDAHASNDRADDRFEAAYAAAQVAVRKLVSTR